MFGRPFFISTFENIFSAQLDGVDEYVNLGSIASFERTDAFSYSAWIKTSVSGVAQAILSKGLQTATQQGLLFHMRTTNKIALFLANSVTGSLYINVEGSTNINDGSWHHVTVTYDGSSLASGITLYVDGSPETPNVLQDTLGSNSIVNTANCQIGARDGTNLPWNGFIDEPVIYNKELSSAENTLIYNTGVPRDLKKLGFASNLYGWWRFTQIDKNNFPVIVDHSGNSRNGTAINMEVGDIQGDVP